MGRIRRTALARADLKEIGHYLLAKSHSRTIALNFLDAIQRKCALYSDQPHLAEACPDLDTGVRRFIVGNYVVFNCPIDGGIELLRVLHGSRDLPSVWRERP